MLKFETITELSAEKLARYDAIIDVRSPSEFAEDHIPCAINLPVLDDEERARVGTIYKQVSPFEARRLGSTLVARNIARHIETALKDKPARFRPLVYCWRGGMRSNAMATILASIGWHPALVEGGYRTWRRQVSAALDDDDTPLPLIVIDGQTGSAKTALLHVLEAQGEQVIDLEGLAAHRGSVFGPLSGQEQPSQKQFETWLWDRIRRFDQERPIFIEAESAMVGKRRIPKRVLFSMRNAPHIKIDAPASVRAAYLLTAYPDLMRDQSKVETALSLLIPHHGHEQIGAWRAMAVSENWHQLALELIETHYDPAYDRARKRVGDASQTVISADTLDSPGLEALANQVCSATSALIRSDTLIEP
ncbi:MAG: tRNA 2-selenouridine(34) synthase MnmH [Alphaproteobacteria bacterium]|nr:tRNA 2-selenouridine(34) synthase MnmH [Alphaproteobacteria bacterium]